MDTRSNRSGKFIRFVSVAASLLAIGLLACPANAEPFELGDLIADFTPPTLAELDLKTDWVDQPVLDALELLRERQRDEKPLTTVERALKMENKTPRDNAMIRSVMGRLPERDEDVDWNAAMIRHAWSGVRTINPIMMSSSLEFDIASLTGFGLFSFDWNFRPFASKDAVSRWQSSKDRLVDKVVMRDDLTWSDGKPITAHDVEFSFQAIMSSLVPVAAVRSGTDRIKYVKAYDDRTIVFFHQEALATNVWNIHFPIIPKHIYEDSIADDPTMQRSAYHVRLESKPVVGGAYALAKRVRDFAMVFERRRGYYMHKGEQVRPRPYIKQVRFEIINDIDEAFAAMKDGIIEELVLQPSQWKKDRDDEFNARNVSLYGTEWVYYYFGWNCESPFFADRRVRQAMSYAFDHERMLKDIRYGMDEAATGIFHPTSSWAPEATAPYKQDIEKAKQLLKEAGWADSDDDGILDKVIDGRRTPFEFSIITTSGVDAIATCELLRDNLKQVGIVCRIRPLEYARINTLSRDHDFDAMFAGWGTGTDPDSSTNLWVTGEPRNYVQYSSAEVDKLFEQGSKEFDLAKRQAIYARIHEKLWEDQPYTWLHWRNSYYAFNKDLRGYNFSPRGPYSYGPGFGSIWKPVKREKE